MGTILLKHAQAIVSCDAHDTVYKDADLLIDGPRILQIGPSLSAPADAQAIDCTGKILYPGLVNTHHHFFQSFVRNISRIECYNMSLLEWLDKIYRIFVRLNEEDIYYASLTAMSDLLKHGCTTAFDLQYCYTPYTGYKPIDLQMQAAAELGMRFHAGRGVNTLPRRLGSTMPDGMVETTEGYLQDAERLIRTYHDASPYSMRQIVLAPCQPTNCYEETFVKSMQLARDAGVRLHTHLAEGENPAMQAKYGMRSLAWCEQHGFIGEDDWYAHCWELTDDEYKCLADHGSGISHCPEAAMLAGVNILPRKRLKELGVPVGLGCDGSATNDGSSMLSCIRIGFLLQAYHCKQRGGSVSAYDLLRAATVNGAKLLGRTDIGSLEAGKAADLFAIDASKLDMVGAVHDPMDLLGRVGYQNEVSMTMVNGQVVFQDGKLLRVDERSLASKAEQVCRQLLSQVPGIL